MLVVHPLQFLQIKPSIGPIDLRQIKALDDFAQRHHLRIVLGRPAEQAQIIGHRTGHIAGLLPALQRGAFVALAHLAAVGIKDQRDMRELRRLHVERAKQCDMLGGVG